MQRLNGGEAQWYSEGKRSTRILMQNMVAGTDKTGKSIFEILMVWAERLGISYGYNDQLQLAIQDVERFASEIKDAEVKELLVSSLIYWYSSATLAPEKRPQSVSPIDESTLVEDIFQLRSIVSETRPDDTATLKHEIGSVMPTILKVPKDDIRRLKIELGLISHLELKLSDSWLQTTAAKGVKG